MKTVLPDAHDRELAVQDFLRNLVVTAGAGAGKTSLLVERILYAVLVRDLPLGFDAESCRADDLQQSLYVVEESVGVWRYGAEPEADEGREPVAMTAPFGQLQGEIKDLIYAGETWEVR